MRGRLPHPGEKGGADTGPSPVDRRKTSSKHHLICDGRGTPLKVITTAANVNDVTQTLALVDGIPPVAGRPGRPRRRPDALLGDKGYDSNPNRNALRERRILPVISRKGSPNIKHRQAPLRRRADLRPAPPLQTPRRPMGTTHRTPRRLRLPRLQHHLLPTPQEGPPMIVLRALRRGDCGGVSRAAAPTPLTPAEGISVDQYAGARRNR
ncbi:transposase [Streptomyces sp. CEV 2-1]|uniref:transposase n=1 Tax=Streptomyces sp. CEV 2-1 TaxID=2485153 RepID=UPI0037DA1369